MRIIILGSNQVSETLASNLASEDNDVVVIDTNTVKLRELQTRYDIQTIEGHGSYPDVLEQAQANDTDILIAVSQVDEVNMLACQVAYSLFHIPVKIARIRTKNYMTHKALYANESLPVDVIISPEQLVTDYVQRLIQQPGTLQVLDFAEGNVQLVALKTSYGGPMVGKSFLELKQRVKEVSANIAAVFRCDQLIPLKDDSTVQVGDEVFIIAHKHDIRPVMSLLRRLDHDNKRIMIAGGGQIGCRLAKATEQDYSVKIIDNHSATSDRLSEELDKAIVLHGDATDKSLLLSENIENIDVFCALTNDDEANIMSCLQAKRLGAKHVMALVANYAYIDIIEDSKIDIVISPQNASISSILAYIRKGDIVNIHSVRRGVAEAIEIIAHGDEETSRVVGKKVRDIMTYDEVRIISIVRKGKMVVPTGDTIIKNQDHVILFVANKKRIKDVERLFQVKVNFF
jgi:trk system potassium uptake protein TrkA